MLTTTTSMLVISADWLCRVRAGRSTRLLRARHRVQLENSASHCLPLVCSAKRYLANAIHPAAVTAFEGYGKSRRHCLPGSFSLRLLAPQVCPVPCGKERAESIRWPQAKAPKTSSFAWVQVTLAATRANRLRHSFGCLLDRRPCPGAKCCSGSPGTSSQPRARGWCSRGPALLRWKSGRGLNTKHSPRAAKNLPSSPSSSWPHRVVCSATEGCSTRPGWPYCC